MCQWESSGKGFSSLAASSRKNGPAGFRAESVPETVLVLPFTIADAFMYFHILIVSSKATKVSLTPW
jgi:hypothetical protein